MDRVDSGFTDLQPNITAEEPPHPLHRSNTAPSSRHRRARKYSPEFPSNPRVSGMEAERPASEKQSARHGRPQESRKSIGSSENSTAKSRGRGHGSKPSSRRTSCTVIDPSRPARHYRIKSTQTVPTVNTDIDDVIALHFRSCSLFSNPSYQSHSGLPSPTISGHEHSAGTDIGPNRSIPGSPTAPHMPSDMAAALPINESTHLNQNEDAVATAADTAAPATATTMHWTSPSTRRREYERIDKANSGIRCLVRRVIPRCVSGPPPTKFYEKDTSDAGSVRRYRMDVSDDEHELDEKSTSSLRLQGVPLEKCASPKKTKKTHKKKWLCF
ncbi:hypothetical protein BS50DRAFT_498377 [Corynespora cassiicola Philippines]|uniref:Pal1-domain-containing protein n=1 Tax=Corynespora cassiicola Philippines TaxID=1448308 RepID=A0A2T2NGU4_CORCC|nr:hypothetical protein BS50DRAFT_498377 [Corynespora cassiicola Philippines]